MVSALLSDLEEYHPEKRVVKTVLEGAQSRVMLLHLLPGQEVPVHPHDGMEVILFPQKGAAVAVWENGAEDALQAGGVYNSGVSPILGIQNRAHEPFQTLVILSRVAD